MVRRRLTLAGLALLAGAALTGACEENRDMAPSAEMPDTTALHEAMTVPAARDALLDTMPGGEMARGDSAAERSLLEEKMPAD